MTSLHLPLSPSFHPLDVGLDLEGMGLSSVSNDVDLFKYFLNEDEIEATSSEVSSPGSYDSSPGVESPCVTSIVSSDLENTPSPNSSPIRHPVSLNVGIPTAALHRVPTTAPVVNIQPKGTAYIPVAIKEEPIDDIAAYEKKRKIKEESHELHDALHYAQMVQNGAFVPEEDRQMKRQRRLIKNRESAQLSRLRKKMYIDDLEKKVNALTQDNDTLTKKVATLVQENKQLSDQVSSLQIALKQSQANANKKLVPSAPSNNGNKNMKAAGVCMLVILFSFGLFFNIKPSDRYKEPTFHVGRVLTAIEEESKPLSLPDQENSSSSEQASSIVSRKRSAEDSLPVVRRAQEKQGFGSSRRKIIRAERKMKIDTDDGNEAGLVPLDQSPAKVSSSSSVHQHPQQLRHIIRQPDTRYIYCSEPQNIFADATQHRARDEEDGTDDQYETNRQINRQPLISLLVPANSSFPSIGVEHENSLMEITCKILSINLYPSLVPLSNNTVN